MKNTLILILILCSILSAHSQLRNNDVYKLTEMNESGIRDIIRIPDIEGYKTLKCDFHTHTVFSDGKVWPDVRVNEAWKEGLDAIAITDHIEYRPLKNTVKGDLNESFKIAKKRGDALGFIVIQGTEITRAKPIGHLNALFIADANPMDTKDPRGAIDIAIAQGAFIMWNHPGWPDNKSTLYPIHDSLINEKKIHGVEVFNHTTYYPVSFDWCKNRGLAFMGNSDIHELVKHDYGSDIAARPVTLVFATERSEKGIKEALFAKRTAACFNGQLAGKAEHLTELFKASLAIETKNAEKGIYEIANISDITYQILVNKQQYSLPAGKTRRITLPKEGKIKILNCFTGMDEHLEVDLPLL
ncbi:MAG: PHP domain-containing protein [Prevotella sp.]|jgi:predicted metal-dependent phosphoesterase TrpH|nr:PHP domain-containing protein [Prevotella sp.]